MGTPEYMAPEQAAGHPADPRSDIYAVGSIMYEMLGGQTPYEGDNVLEVLHKKANEPPVPLAELRPGLAPSVIALVDRAMAHMPEDRPRSMAELAQEIRALEATLVQTPTPVSVPVGAMAQPGDEQLEVRSGSAELSQTRVIVPLSDRRRLLMMIGAGAVLLTGVAFWLLARSVRENREGPPRSTVVVQAAVPNPVAPPAPVVLDAAAEAGVRLDADVEPEPAAPHRREPGARSLRVAPSTSPKIRRIGEESLRQAKQLLHAQRYDEARVAFEKLLSNRRLKGAAAAGLAKIAFQEEDYKSAVERAKESARTGGGVEARVLLGDAYFKLERFEEAKKAYNEALKRDPNNRVAGQGLRLVESRLSP
jgi:TolA-binding protein